MNWELTYNILTLILKISIIFGITWGFLYFIIDNYFFDFWYLHCPEWVRRAAKKIYLSSVALILLVLFLIILFAIFN